MSGHDFSATLAQRQMFKLAKADYLDGIHPVKRRVNVSINSGSRSVALRGEGIDESWAFDDLRLLPSESAAGRLTLTLGDHGSPRLVLAEPQMISELLDAHPDLDATGPARGAIGRAVLLGAGAAGAIAAIVLFLMPMLAGRLAPMISPEAEVAFATAMRQQVIDRAYPTCGTPESDAAWNTMTAALTQGLDIPYDIDVSIVLSPDINAFAMPGGQIVFFSGLIEAAEDPDEVAAVLAHEIGHVVYRDVTESALRQTGTYGLVGLMFGDVTGASMIPAVANGLLSASHSQSAETRADAFAHERMEAAGQSPAALGRMFRRMVERYGEFDQGVFAHFSTHPEIRARIEAAETAGANGPTGTPIVSEAEWSALRTACDTLSWNPAPLPFGLDGVGSGGPTPQTQRTESPQMTQRPAPAAAPGAEPQPQAQAQPAPPTQPQVNRLPQVGQGGGADPVTIRVEPAAPEPQTTGPAATDGPPSDQPK